MKRKARAGDLPTRPPMPREACVYVPADWGAPDAPGGEGVSAWEADHRHAYAAWEVARREWYDEYGHRPVSGDPVPDEPFDGSH